MEADGLSDDDGLLDTDADGELETEDDGLALMLVDGELDTYLSPS